MRSDFENLMKQASHMMKLAEAIDPELVELEDMESLEPVTQQYNHPEGSEFSYPELQKQLWHEQRELDQQYPFQAPRRTFGETARVIGGGLLGAGIAALPGVGMMALGRKVIPEHWKKTRTLSDLAGGGHILFSAPIGGVVGMAMSDSKDFQARRDQARNVHDEAVAKKLGIVPPQQRLEQLWQDEDAAFKRYRQHPAVQAFEAKHGYVPSWE